eukprot:2734523-Rhodomonas_salina.2
MRLACSRVGCGSSAAQLGGSSARVRACTARVRGDPENIRVRMVKVAVRALHLSDSVSEIGSVTCKDFRVLKPSPTRYWDFRHCATGSWRLRQKSGSSIRLWPRCDFSLDITAIEAVAKAPCTVAP